MTRGLNLLPTMTSLMRNHQLLFVITVADSRISQRRRAWFLPKNGMKVNQIRWWEGAGDTRRSCPLDPPMKIDMISFVSEMERWLPNMESRRLRRSMVSQDVSWQDLGSRCYAVQHVSSSYAVLLGCPVCFIIVKLCRFKERFYWNWPSSRRGQSSHMNLFVPLFRNIYIW